MSSNLPSPRESARPPVPVERAVALRGARQWGIVSGVAAVTALVVVWNSFAVGMVALVFALATGAQALRLLLSSVPDASSVGNSPAGSDPLKQKINKLRFMENVGRHGENAADQYDRAQARMKTTRALLDEKFQPDELAYARFKGALEQTRQAIGDNLMTVSGLLANASQIDAKDADPERLKIREGQLAKTIEILGFNERAITELDRLSATLGEIQTKRKNTSPDIEAALKDLEELVDLAKKLSI